MGGLGANADDMFANGGTWLVEVQCTSWILNGEAPAAIVCATVARKQVPHYGAKLNQHWSWLEKHVAKRQRAVRSFERNA